MKACQIKKTINFLGININNVSKEEFISLLIGFCQKGGLPKKVFCTTAHVINVIMRNKEHKEIFASADLIGADGMGVVWASRILGTPLKERINNAELFDNFCINVIKHKMSIYFLGAREQVIENAVKKLKNKYPDLNIVGAHQGYFLSWEENKVIDEINRLRPNFLIIGMGTPRQELWIHNNLNRLNIDVCWAVGGLFDLLSGRLTYPPLLIRKCGLEWFYRLIHEPRRLWRRYLIGNTIFIFIILKELLKSLYQTKIYNFSKRLADI